MLDFFQQYGLAIIMRSREHLMLTVIALLIAAFVSVPLGIFLTRCRFRIVVSIVMGAVNTIQPIPSLATVALTVVIFFYINVLANHLFGGGPLRTLGVQPALVSLVAYALLPILRNTYTGIRQVDEAVVEVARGMGMTTRQILFSIQLPLALPFIMAGIRISTVWTVGVATLVSLVGAGGLGDFIFQGLSNYRIDLILAGALPAALLALILDWLLGRLEIWLTPAGLLGR